VCLQFFKLLNELWLNLQRTGNCTVSQTPAFKRAYFGTREKVSGQILNNWMAVRMNRGVVKGQVDHENRL